MYFDQILSLFFSKKCHFLYINILDTHLLWGISREEIFENLLRMRFGVYLKQNDYFHKKISVRGICYMRKF